MIMSMQSAHETQGNRTTLPKRALSLHQIAEITDYTALLQQIPAIEYKYPARGSSSGLTHTKVGLNHSSDKPRTTLHSTAVEDSTVSWNPPPANAGSLTAEDLLPALERLRNISERRERLFNSHLKVESIQKQLEESRRAIKKEVWKSLHLVEGQAFLDIGDLQTAWSKSLSQLQACLAVMEEDEHELQLEQNSLIAAHNDFKRSIKELFASITYGGRMDESQASAEDDFLRAIRKEDSGMNEPLHRSPTMTASSESDPVSESEPTTLPGSREDLDFASKTASSSATRIWTRPLTKVPSAISFESEQQEPLPSKSPANPSKAKLPGIKSKPSKHPELTCCGFNLIPDNRSLIKFIHAAEKCDILIAPQDLKNIRKKDLGPELDAVDQVLSNSRTNNTDSTTYQPIRKTIIEKFRQAEVNTFYKSDYVSLWGANMSQNSWTDLHRSVLQHQSVEHDAQKPFNPSELDAPLLTDYLRALDIPSVQYARRIPGLDVSPNLQRAHSRLASIPDDSSLKAQYTEFHGVVRRPKSRQQSPVSSIRQLTDAEEQSRLQKFEHPSTSDKAHLQEIDDRTAQQTGD